MQLRWYLSVVIYITIPIVYYTWLIWKTHCLCVTRFFRCVYTYILYIIPIYIILFTFRWSIRGGLYRDSASRLGIILKWIFQNDILPKLLTLLRRYRDYNMAAWSQNTISDRYSNRLQYFIKYRVLSKKLFGKPTFCQGTPSLQM